MSGAFRSLILADEAEPFRQKNRNDYRTLSTEQILRLIGRANYRLDERCEANDERLADEFLVQELRAVLKERG